VSKLTTIAVTIRDLMMKDERFDISKHATVRQLCKMYCERTGANLDTLTFCFQDSDFDLTTFHFDEQLNDVCKSSRGELRPRALLTEIQVDIYHGEILTVRPKMVKDIQVIFRDAMHKEERFGTKDTTQLCNVVDDYLVRTGLESKKLQFTLDGAELTLSSLTVALKQACIPAHLGEAR